MSAVLVVRSAPVGTIGSDPINGVCAVGPVSSTPNSRVGRRAVALVTAISIAGSIIIPIHIILRINRLIGRTAPTVTVAY